MPQTEMLAPSGADSPELPVPPALFVDPTLLAAMDIGTNSVRMALVRLDEQTHNWTLLSTHKETVRLGQGEFRSNQIEDEAMKRGVLVLAKFAEIARGYGAGEIVAIATAALREAENRDVFLAQAKEVAGVEVRIAPGVEEARLIYLGVASGMEIGGKRALFIDIGGGSTELIVGTQNEYLLLESLKLGAIRLGNRFLEGVTGPISPALYDTMRQYVRGVASHAVRKVRETGFDMAIASSGTAMNLAQVTAKRKGQDVQTVRNYALSLSDLTQTAQMLCKLSLEERRRVPGLNPERADIIISGAAVLQTIAEEMGISSLLISDRSLREGVLVDALKRRATPYSDTATLRENNGDSGVRRRSIERLLRLVPGEEVHARHVAFLTLRLFDQTRTLGLHPYGERERELLEYAALAHDIGIFVSHSGHHRHSFYLIRHSELAGFTDLETRLIANMAYFHRKSTPKKRHEHFMELSPDDQKRVRRLSALLRVAEGLDRSHLGLVKDVKLVFAPDTGRRRTVRLQIQSSDDPRLELWYVGSEREAFADAFGVELELSSREP